MISLDPPTPNTAGNPSLVWGAVTLQGYALEPTPLLPSEAVTGVNVTLVRDDDTGYTVTGTATYGSNQSPRYDACGGNGRQGTYPNSPGCPYVNFVYTWLTGGTPTAPLPNAVYTATFSASDNGSPAVSNSVQATYTVNNQFPTSTINSPINGSGAPGTQQTFSVTYTSPNSSQDIGFGQISFTGSASCVVQWDTTPSVTLLSGASNCGLATGGTVTANAAASQVTVQFGITFQPSMAGQVNVIAKGTDSSGLMSPPSYLTAYTVTGPQILSSLNNSQRLFPYGSSAAGYSGFWCQSLDLIGTQGPVSIGTPTIDGTPAGFIFSANYQAIASFYCPAGTVQLYAYFPPGTDPGWTMTVHYSLTAGSASLNMEFWVVASAEGQFSLTFSQSSVTVPQGGSATVNVTATPLNSFYGTIDLFPNTGIGSLQMNLGSLSISTSGSTTVTFTALPGLAAGVYPVYLYGEAPGETFTFWTGVFVTVTATATPDFTISSTLPTSIQAGQSINFTGNVVPTGGFSGTVVLTGLSAGITPGLTLPNSVTVASGTPASFTGTITSTLDTVTCSSHVIALSATSGSLHHYGFAYISVQGGAQPFATPFWNPVTVTAGNTGSIPISATATACFTGTPSFATAGFPAGITFTPPSNPPTITGPIPATFPVSLGSLGVSVANGFPAGPYTGTLTVTLGGHAYTQPLNVTVASPVAPPAPSYTLSCTNCGSGIQVSPGSNAIALIGLTAQNSYAGSPVLSIAGGLPAGVTVTFDNNATESVSASYVVSAKISASADAVPGSFSIHVNGWDGSSNSASVYVPVQVNALPLTLSSAVVYSTVSPTTQTPLIATLKMIPAGGTPPYGIQVSGDVSIQGVVPSGEYDWATGVSGWTSPRHLTIAVTDSSYPQQTFTKHTLIPVAQPINDNILHAALLHRIIATESLIRAEGGSDVSGMRTALQGRLGITSSQYGNTTPGAETGLVGLAVQYRAEHTANVNAFQSALSSLHARGLSAGPATASSLGPVESANAADAALPAKYKASVQSALGSGFSAYDQNGWSFLSGGGDGGGDGGIGGCDPTSGCDPCDPEYEDCNDPGAPPVVVIHFYGGMSIDDSTGLALGYAEEWLEPVSGYVASDSPDLNVTVNISGQDSNGNTINVQPVATRGESTTVDSYVDVYAQLTQAGTYTATGTADARTLCLGNALSGGCYQAYAPAMSGSDTEQFNPSCSTPTIESIVVDGQISSQLVIGRSGTMVINGACLDSTTQVSISIPVTITAVTPSGWGVVSAQYSVDPNAAPTTATLVVWTPGGTASADLDVVASSPGINIDSIVPNVWPAGQPTTVAIAGSGFGNVFGSLTAVPDNVPASDISALQILSWTDNLIALQVTTSPTSTGDSVTITVTGGSNYGAATGFQPQQGRGTTTGRATIGPSGPVSSPARQA